jgi:hypothetical protein
MSPETARPATWGSRPGLDDFRGQRKSGPSLAQNSLFAQAERRLRRQQQVEQVHRLGARVVFELLDELDRHHDLGDALDRRLARYAALDPGILPAVGGDKFALAPMRLVEGGR